MSSSDKAKVAFNWVKFHVPIGSALALLVSWFGLGFFCTKLYYGIDAAANLARDLFADFIPYMEKAKAAAVGIGISMAIVTFLMLIVGILATRKCRQVWGCSAGRLTHCFGGRICCAIFWCLNYLLNLCWLFVFSFVVVLGAIYLGFSPLCLPMAGNPSAYCFNMSIISQILAGNDPKAMVSLNLCGYPIDKFCQMTRVILPWYWWAYFGCLFVLLGLLHFNACLAANFARNNAHSHFHQEVSRCSSSMGANGSIYSLTLTDSKNSTPSNKANHKHMYKFLPMIQNGSCLPSSKDRHHHSNSKLITNNNHYDRGAGIDYIDSKAAKNSHHQLYESPPRSEEDVEEFEQEQECRPLHVRYNSLRQAQKFAYELDDVTNKEYGSDKISPPPYEECPSKEAVV